MKAENVTLTLLRDDDREQFILDNQRAFKYGATEEFGQRPKISPRHPRGSRNELEVFF